MAKKATILKRQRQESKKKSRNKMVISRIKTLIKKTRENLLQNTPAASDNLKIASKEIDKAASKKIIHKNTAARKKSRLQKFSKKFASGK